MDWLVEWARPSAYLEARSRMLRAFVLRHAQSVANQDALLSSAEPGPGLTELGLGQCAARAESLSDEGVVHIYSSPLRRTMTTAQVIADRLGLEVEPLNDLREFALGDWEGRPGTDLDVLEHPVFAGWLHHERLHETFQGGESGHQIRQRLERSLDRVVADDPIGTVVLVTHGGVMAVAVPLVTGSRSTIPRIPANAEAWELTYDGLRWTTPEGGDPAPWQGPIAVLDG